jgi:lysophospholipase L1-like esterase
MTRSRLLGPQLLLLLLAVLLLDNVVGYAQQAAKLHPRRIAIWGSSVANGRGDELARDGYTGLLRTMMAARGWEVLNQSRGGDNTRSIVARFMPAGAPDPKVRYLTTVNPSYVVIGLSFGNEGLYEAKTTAEKEAVFKGYAEGIRALVDRARQHNIVPIISGVYTRSVYTPEDYMFVRRMNVLQQQWDVPLVNFLGATDDGAGRWSLGWDDKHPQTSGHREMFYTFVPTLFEALEAGKPTPVKPASGGFARITGGRTPLTFVPDGTIHPFAVSVMVRAQGNGTIASLAGSMLATRKETRPNEGTPFEATTLVADRPFTASVIVQNGKWAYQSAVGTVVDSGVAADAQWHHVVLSHYTGWGETHLYVDGKLAGKVTERLEPNRFVIGGPGSAGGPAGPKQADYRDLYIFRAALNADEVAVLTEGKVLQGSLEVYAPLRDAAFAANGNVENRAQSLAALKIGADRIVRMEDAGTN